MDLRVVEEVLHLEVVVVEDLVGRLLEEEAVVADPLVVEVVAVGLLHLVAKVGAEVAEDLLQASAEVEEAYVPQLVK